MDLIKIYFFLYVTAAAAAAAICHAKLNFLTEDWREYVIRNYYSIVLCFGYFLILSFDSGFKRDGYVSPWFQRLKVWKWFQLYFNATVEVESPLISKQNYIFAFFPHGAVSASHTLTMTDSAGMLSKVHTGDRRDLAASILFYLPVIREILMLLGNVDASKKTGKYDLCIAYYLSLSLYLSHTILLPFY